MMILTNVEVGTGRKSQWRIVQAYLSRWMVEETIRFIKQSYHLEDLRVLDYDRLRNLVALVLAVAYFTAVWLGESLKLSVLLTKATTMAKRFFGVPDFHYYAIADGLSALLRSLGRYESRSGPAEFPEDPRQAELGLSF
ncbi:MAG: transposase [Kiritimatiellia bacterium]